jgi:hypothetical protein
MGLPLIATIASGIGAATQVYSTFQQSKSAQNAAEFNAEQARNAAKVSAEDARNQSLRDQERNRKHLGELRARMFAKGSTIEGGDSDFLGESVGVLQQRVLDAATVQNRRDASYQNAAFRSDFQAEQYKSSRGIQTFSSALSGFNSVYKTGKEADFWGQPKSDPDALPVKKDNQNY